MTDDLPDDLDEFVAEWAKVTVTTDPNPLRPRDLPDLRLKLVDAWAPGHAFDRALQLAGGDRGAGLKSLRGFDGESLLDAQLFWVSPDTCATVQAAEDSFPTDTVLTETMLPADAGFVVFSLPFLGLDAEHPDQDVRVDALQWGPVRLRCRNTGIEGYGLAMTTYAWMFDTNMLVPLGRSDWLHGRALDAQSFDTEPIPADALASIIEDRRILATLAALVDHPRLVETRDEGIDRATARRSTRAGVDPDRVRVHTLRLHGETSTGPTGEDDGGESRFSVRWVVRGHWRSQPHGPGRSLRRPVWVAPHVKGPDGAPMLDPHNRVTRL